MIKRTRAAIRVDIEKVHRQHTRAVEINAANLPDITRRVCDLAAELRDCLGMSPHVGRDAYTELCRAAAGAGMPLIHKTDLTQHDDERLAGDDAPPRFGWVLRESGTLLLDPRMGRDHLDLYLEHVTGSGRSENDRCFIWDGTALRAVNPGSMFAALREWSEAQPADPDKSGY